MRVYVPMLMADGVHVAPGNPTTDLGAAKEQCEQYQETMRFGNPVRLARWFAASGTIHSLVDDAGVRLGMVYVRELEQCGK